MIVDDDGDGDARGVRGGRLDVVDVDVVSVFSGVASGRVETRIDENDDAEGETKSRQTRGRRRGRGRRCVR